MAAFAYNAALSACARAEQVGPLRATLREMHRQRVPADAHTFSITMDGLARGGMGEEALQLFERMGTGDAPAPDQVCFNTAIAAAAAK